MWAADCSMAAPGPVLPLCQDLTSLDYHHNIHQLSSTQPPLPPTSSLLPSTHSLPPGQFPPAGSSLNDTLSICLIISPLATPLWSSLGSTFFSQGGAKGQKTLQLDFLTAHLEGHALFDTTNPSLSSSKLRATVHRKIASNIFIVHQGEQCVRKCRQTSFYKVCVLNPCHAEQFYLESVYYCDNQKWLVCVAGVSEQL